MEGCDNWTAPKPLVGPSSDTQARRRGTSDYPRGRFAEATALLPAVADDVLVAALRAVISAGGELGRKPALREQLTPLFQMADARDSEPFPTVARRILDMLDASFRQDMEAFADDAEPLLSSDWADGLRILFGTHPEYREADVRVRRICAADLLYPEEGPWTGRYADNRFYKTWEEPTVYLTIPLLRRTYGQEPIDFNRYHESVQRTNTATIGLNRRKREVVARYVSRSVVERLDCAFTHFSAQRTHEGIDEIYFDPLTGVGEPEIKKAAPWVWELRFPLLQPVGLGETFSWSFRRRYTYLAEAPPISPDWLQLNGNVPGFSALIEVAFECDFPEHVWSVATHIDRIPGSYEPRGRLTPGTDRMLRFETSNTRPECGYGIAWSWRG